MQLEILHKRFDTLHKKYGSKDLRSIYGAGETDFPLICFVFMNPTARNISAVNTWKGLRAPWLGTKNTWKLMTSIGVISEQLNSEIQSKKPHEWNTQFADKVYGEIKKKGCFITNLAKCTQGTAAHISDSVFKEYIDLMHEEIDLLKPKVIITFGNQVSSILLNRPIHVSQTRKQSYKLLVKEHVYAVYPVFYPVGQGMRNISKSIADLKHILAIYQRR